VYQWEDGCYRADGYFPEDAVVREVFAVEQAGRPVAVPEGVAVAEAWQAVPGGVVPEGAPAGVLQGAKVVVRDGPGVPARKPWSKYLLPKTGCLCVRFLTARWAA